MTPTTLRVLCGVGFDNAGEAAFAQACAIARHGGAPLCLLHAVPAAAPFCFADERHLATFSQYRERAVSADVPVTLRVEHDDPAPALARVAAHDRYNLVVVGRRRGGNGTRRASLPAIVEGIAGTGLAPVLIVPDGARPVRSRFRRLVWAVGKTPLALDAEDAALRLTQPEWLDITLVNVLRRGESRDASIGRLTEALSDDVRRLVRPRLRVLQGAVPQAVIRAAARENADLIVAGAGGSGRAASASTLASIVERATTPVLVLPAAVDRAGVPLAHELSRAA